MRKQSKLEGAWWERMYLAATAACGLALSIGVIVGLIYLLLALASMVPAPSVFVRTAGFLFGPLVNKPSQFEQSLRITTCRTRFLPSLRQKLPTIRG